MNTPIEPNQLAHEPKRGPIAPTETHLMLSRKVRALESSRQGAERIAESEALALEPWKTARNELLKERDRLRAELNSLREELDWQNKRNSAHPTCGGFEFYINEEWTGLANAALDADPGYQASLRKVRCDPDDERVRVRRAVEDDALISERDQLRSEVKRLNRRDEERASVIEVQTRQLEELRAALRNHAEIVEGYRFSIGERGMEIASLRAEVERLKDHAFDKDGTPWKTVCGWWSTKYDAAERQMRENAARAEKAEAELAKLRSKPCPHVITSGEGTAHCSLAERDGQALAKERARVRTLREALTEIEENTEGWTCVTAQIALKATKDQP